MRLLDSLICRALARNRTIRIRRPITAHTQFASFPAVARAAAGVGAARDAVVAEEGGEA